MGDKVIVINRSAFQTKYGDVSAIEKAVDALIAADKQRGIEAKVADIAAKTPKEAKDAVDAIAKQFDDPDYITLLGGPDVIPHQDLQNPLFSPNGDADQIVWSDLPYACEAPYSTNVNDFIGPTRVVGRIPDLPGATEPSFLITLLENAAKWTSNSADAYANCFGLSTVEWEDSTRLSLKNLFGDKATVNLSPDSGPNWEDAMLSSRAHFINCHGADNDSQFYGQRGWAFPVSHQSAALKSKKFDGAVVAAECCYGGQLFAPPSEDGWGICTRYLAGGAYAYFGSTTIAYGPAKSNGLADILCQSFLKKAISGSSSGRAVLEARQEYVKATPTMGPQDLKTIAQFHLLGDPSVHAVKSEAAVQQAIDNPPAGAGPQAKGLPFGMRFDPKSIHEAAMRLLPPDAERAARRAMLKAQGLAAAANHAVAQRISEVDGLIRGQLEQMERQLDLNLDTREVVSYVVQRSGRALTAADEAATRFHLVMGRRKIEGASHLPNVVALIAREVGGKLEYEELHSK